MRAVVFGNADIEDYNFCVSYIENSKIICCDGGMRHAKALGIIPDLIVGDFDSADENLYKFFADKKVPVKKFPTHKDETDLELGTVAAKNMGADEIILIGGIGSRMDHTLANCQMLARLLKDGIKSKLINEKNIIMITESSIKLLGKKGSIVSLFPVGYRAEGVTTKNLEYALFNATLSIESTLIAISNVMLEEEAEVSVKKGMLYVMQCSD